MENCHVDWRVLANLSQIAHHLFLVVGVGDVDGLDQESRRLDFGFILVELHVEGEGVAGVEPVLKGEKMVLKVC